MSNKYNFEIQTRLLPLAREGGFSDDRRRGRKGLKPKAVCFERKVVRSKKLGGFAQEVRQLLVNSKQIATLHLPIGRQAESRPFGRDLNERTETAGQT